MFLCQHEINSAAKRGGIFFSLFRYRTDRMQGKSYFDSGIFYIRQQRQSGIGLPVSWSARYRWHGLIYPATIYICQECTRQLMESLEYIIQTPPYKYDLS